MSNYIQYKTFATRAAFLSWRTDLGHDAAAYCVTITANNETFSFSINISKPIQQAGLNDLIVWSNTDGCFKAFPQSILRHPRTSGEPTGKYCQLSEVYASGLSNCIVLGTVIDKAGGKLKIADIDAASSLAWQGNSSSYSETVPNVHTSSSVRNGQGGTYWTGAWDWFLTNVNYASNPAYVGYWIGVTKTAWDAAVTSHKTTGTRESGAVTATSGQISGIYYVQDYNYDYDLFQRRNVLARFPARNTDANAVLNGREQTLYIVKNATITPYAAKYCYERNKGVTGFNTNDWWLPTIDEAIKINRARAEIGKGSYLTIWSCVQYAASDAWAVSAAGPVFDYPKYRGHYAVPVSALDISNL